VKFEQIAKDVNRRNVLRRTWTYVDLVWVFPLAPPSNVLTSVLVRARIIVLAHNVDEEDRKQP
jgi:hypothetical protein